MSNVVMFIGLIGLFVELLIFTDLLDYVTIGRVLFGFIVSRLAMLYAYFMG